MDKLIGSKSKEYRMAPKLVSARQIKLLLDFMEQHHSLALGRVRGKESSAMSSRLWLQCATILNCDLNGAQKSSQEWKKYYNQYKSRTKAKQRAIIEGLSKNGGSVENIMLTPLEERLIAILGESSSSILVRHKTDMKFDLIPEDDCEEESGNERSAGADSSSFGGSISFEAGPSSPKKIFIDVKDFYIAPKENVEGVSDAVSSAVPTIKTENVEEESDTVSSALPAYDDVKQDTYGRDEISQSRDKNERPNKRRRRYRSSTPKENNEFEEAGQRLAAIEQSRLEVDRELTKAIHRHASAVEEIGKAINRFVNIYKGSLQANRRRRYKNSRVRSSSSRRTSSDSN